MWTILTTPINEHGIPRLSFSSSISSLSDFYKILNIFSLPSFQSPVVRTVAQLAVIKKKALGIHILSFLFPGPCSEVFLNVHQLSPPIWWVFFLCDPIPKALSSQGQTSWYPVMHTADFPAKFPDVLAWTSALVLLLHLGQ